MVCIFYHTRKETTFKVRDNKYFNASLLQSLLWGILEADLEQILTPEDVKESIVW